MRIRVCLLLAAIASPAARGDSPAPAKKPPDMAAPAPPPAKLTRALSDAWGYNRLQISVLDGQKKQLEDALKKTDEALGKLAGQKAELDKRLKEEFRVDVAAGDAWDEASLDIKRRQ